MIHFYLQEEVSKGTIIICFQRGTIKICFRGLIHFYLQEEVPKGTIIICFQRGTIKICFQGLIHFYLQEEVPKDTITACKFSRVLSPIESNFQNSILGGSLYGLILFAEFKLLLILLNSETKKAT